MFSHLKTLAMANIYGHRLLNRYSVMSDILDIGVVEAFHYISEIVKTGSKSERTQARKGLMRYNCNRFIFSQDLIIHLGQILRDRKILEISLKFFSSGNLNQNFDTIEKKRKMKFLRMFFEILSSTLKCFLHLSNSNDSKYFPLTQFGF